MKRTQKNPIMKMLSRSFIRRHLLMLVIVASLIGMTLLPFQLFYLSSGDLAYKSGAAGHETTDGVNNAINRATNRADTTQQNIRQSHGKDHGSKTTTTTTTTRSKGREGTKEEDDKLRENAIDVVKKNEKCMFPDELTPIWRLFDEMKEQFDPAECFKFQSTEETHSELNKMKMNGEEREISCTQQVELRTLEQATVYWNEDDLMIENDLIFTSASTLCRFPERKLTRSKPKSSTNVYQYSIRDEINEAILILTDPEDDGAEIYMLPAVRRLLDANPDLIVLLQATTLRTKDWYTLFNFQPDIASRLRIVSGTEQVKKLHLLRNYEFCGRASAGCKRRFRNWLLELIKSVRLDFMLQMFDSGPSLCLLYRADSACAFPSDDQDEDNVASDEKETCRGLAAGLTRDLRSESFMPNLQVSHILTEGTGFDSPTEAFEMVSHISQCDSFLSLNELPLFQEILHKDSSRMLRFGLAGDVLDDSFENIVEHDTLLAWESNYSVYFPKTKQELFQIARKFVKGDVVVANSFHDNSKSCSRSSKDKFRPYLLLKDNDCFPISAKLKKIKQAKSKVSSVTDGKNWMDYFVIKLGAHYSNEDITNKVEDWWKRYRQAASQNVITRQIDHVTIFPVISEDDAGNEFSRFRTEPHRGINDDKKFHHHIQSDSLWTSLDACLNVNSTLSKKELIRLASFSKREVNRWVDEAVVLSSSQLSGTLADRNFKIDFIGLAAAREILDSNANAKVVLSMMSERNRLPSREIAEFLDLIEIDSSRILYLDALSSIKVNKLHLSFPIHCGLLGHDTAKHMRKWIRDVNQYVYTERKNHPRKNNEIVLFANLAIEYKGIQSVYDAIQKAFPDRKIRYLDHGAPVRTQMEILARAEFLIGTDLVTMIFLPDHGKVIEMKSAESQEFSLEYFGLAQALDLQYRGLLAEEERGTPPQTYHYTDPDYVVRAMNSMMGSSTS